MKDINAEQHLPPRAVIFDLDGTLADTLESIAAAVNTCLDKMGRRTVPVDDYRYLVGDGLRVLCERVLCDRTLRDRTLCENGPEPDFRLVLQLEADVKDHYSRHLLDHVALYDGIPELLEQLRNSGARLAVCSNKPDKHTRLLIDALVPAGTFGSVLGARDDVPRKPDPAAALKVAADLGVAPGECLFVGDTSIDMETARSAGMIPVGVLWGFRPRKELEESGARYIVERPEKIAALIAR